MYVSLFVSSAVVVVVVVVVSLSSNPSLPLSLFTFFPDHEFVLNFEKNFSSLRS